VLIGWLGTLMGLSFGLGVSLNLDIVVPVVEHTLGFHIFNPDVFSVEGIPSEPHVGEVVLIVVTALLMTVAATIYPALQAAKTHPAEALRYE
jgi:lipoprotein-releasing system permease protein